LKKANDYDKTSKLSSRKVEEVAIEGEKSKQEGLEK
jgi:hypothetical protein